MTEQQIKRLLLIASVLLLVAATISLGVFFLCETSNIVYLVLTLVCSVLARLLLVVRAKVKKD